MLDNRLKKLLKQEMLRKLDTEKEFSDWAVRIIRKGRRNKNYTSCI